MSIVPEAEHAPVSASGVRRLVVAITGASGSIFGVRLMEKLALQKHLELHLVVSRTAERTAFLELGSSMEYVKSLAHFTYPHADVGCRIASGSFQTDGMIVAPCSIHTMGAVAYGISSNLIVRAADVCLKEHRRLILMVREMPFHLGHLRTMCQLAEMGAIIAPPVPGFYHKPQTLMELVDFCVDRVLDLAGVPDPGAKRWLPREHE